MIKNTFKSKRTNLIVLLGLMFIISIVIGSISINFNAFAKGNNDVNLKDVYEYNDVVTIPQHNITVDGKSYKATPVINMPNGKATSLTKFKVTECGKYIVDYRLKLNGKNYSEKYSFVVPYSAYTMGLKSDKVEYKTKNGVEGLYVTLSQGGEILFNHSIDRKLLKKGSDLISFYISPFKQGDYECRDLFLDIIDGIDEENMVTIRFNQSPDTFGSNINYDVVYMKAKSSNQDKFYGYERGFSDSSVAYGGDYGFAANSSFFGLHFGDKNYMTTVSYDDAKQAVYSPNNYYTEHSNIVMEINNPQVNADCLWSGFKGRFVKLRLRADNFDKSNMTFVITKLLGANLNNPKLEINKASDIVVDSDYEEDNYPIAEVGKPYKIFNAYGMEQYTKEKLEVNVFTGYGSSTRRNVLIENNSFVPTYEGIYTIEYKVIDGFGNENIKTINVEAVNSISPVEFNVLGHQEEIVIGNYFTPGVISDLSGGTGKLNTKIYLGEKGSENKEEITKKTRIIKQGEYEVTYSVTDYVDNCKEIVKNLVVLPADKPLIIGSVVLPKAFILGGEYVIPELKAEDFSSGKIEDIDCDITIYEGSNKVDYNGKYKPLTEGKVTIIYTAKDKENRIAEKSFESVVINTGFPKAIDITKYFGVENGTILATKNSIELTGGANAKFSFLRELLGDVETELNLNSVNSKTSGIKITITDFYNENNNIIVTLTKDNDRTLVTINNKISKILKQPLGGEMFFNISLKDNKISVQEADFIITETMENNAFSGFKKAYISYSFIDSSEDCTILLRQINRQPMNKRKNDIIEPRMKITSMEIKDGNLGDVIQTATTLCVDVIDPYSTSLVTVTAPDETIAEDVNGIKIENLPSEKAYGIKLNQFGSYIVHYKYQDSKGNARMYTYVIMCMDKVKPEIIIKDGDLKAEKGDEFVLPEFEVKDNVSGEGKTKTWLVMINPEGRIETIIDGKYKFEMSGVFVFRIMAVDEYNNISLKDINVVVR